MKPQIKQKWLDALRSGEYEQCESNLHKNGGFCCLGVLTDLYIQEHSDCSWKEYESNDKQLYYSFVGIKIEYSYLPDEVVEWADLSSENPRVVSDRVWTHLSDLNDCGFNFEKIANLIEGQL